MNKLGKLKKTMLWVSSYSPDAYTGAIGEYRGIINYRCGTFQLFQIAPLRHFTEESVFDRIGGKV